MHCSGAGEIFRLCGQSTLCATGTQFVMRSPRNSLLAEDQKCACLLLAPKRRCGELDDGSVYNGSPHF